MNKEKRVNGQGAVFYSESNKKWIAKIQVGTDNNGNPIIKRFSSTKSKSEATKKLEEFKRKMLINEYSSNKAILNDYIENWLELYQKPKVKATTLHRDVTAFENHIRHTIGHMKLKDIDVQVVQNLINSEKTVMPIRLLRRLIVC